MKVFQTAVLILIGIVLLLLAISPLAAQKGVPVEPTPGNTGFVQYETLVVIYPSTVAGEIDGAQVEQVKEQVRQVSAFVWRNSGFKFFPHLTFLVLDEYVDGTEFFAHWGGCGWLYPNDLDGDGESPEADLLAAGVTAGQYDSINLLWAHNNGEITPCASGSTWADGWQWQTLGRTMLTTGPIFTYGESITNPFYHEFQHGIHGAMDLGGNDAYFDVDQPWMEAQRFGGEWHFQAVMMRAWPHADWFDLLGAWGTYAEAPDKDGDSVPDSGDLPLTEATLGSSPAAVDTDGDGVDDFHEALAGMFRAGNAQAADSDGDGRFDAADPFPLYPLREQITRRRHVLNGDAGGWTLLTGHLEQAAGEFAAGVYADWYDGTLYLMFVLNQPADVHVRLDGHGDGFWHGRDNYELHLTPDADDPLLWLGVLDCSSEQIDGEGVCRYDSDPLYQSQRLVTPQEVGRIYTRDGERFITQVAIPASELSGFEAAAGQEVGLGFHYDFVDGELGRKASTFEPDELVYLPLRQADGGIRIYFPFVAK